MERLPLLELLPPGEPLALLERPRRRAAHRAGAAVEGLDPRRAVESRQHGPEDCGEACVGADGRALRSSRQRASWGLARYAGRSRRRWLMRAAGWGLAGLRATAVSSAREQRPIVGRPRLYHDRRPAPARREASPVNAAVIKQHGDERFILYAKLIKRSGRVQEGNVLKPSCDLKQILGLGAFDDVLSNDFGRNTFEILLHSQFHGSSRGLAGWSIFLKQPYRQPDTLKAGCLVDIAKPDGVDQCLLSFFGSPECNFRSDVVKRKSYNRRSKIGQPQRDFRRIPGGVGRDRRGSKESK